MRIALLTALLFAASLDVTAPISSDTEGICVVEFNASFNSQNSVSWIEELSDCKGKRVDIAEQPNMQIEHNIVVVPTIIVFNDGEEVERFQANIMMQMEASQDEVQEAVDEVLLSWF